MTKFQPAFEGQARCEYKKGTVHRCTVGTSVGEKFCTQHKPVVTIDAQGDSRTNTVLKGFDVKAIMARFNRTCMAEGCDEHRVTGPASAGKPISKYCSAHRHMEDAAVAANTSNTTKEESTMEKKGLFSTVKATVTSVKESKLYKWMKRQVSALASQKAAIAVGSASAVLGGLFTASCGTAMVVGTAIAVLMTAAAHAMTKKKEQSLSYKAMLSDMGVAVATVAVMPAVLFVAAYVGLYATVYGAILPYAIIVA